MRVLSRQQAIASLVLMSLSVAVQVFVQPLPLWGLAAVMLAVAWYHWIVPWPIPTYLKLSCLLLAVVMIAVQHGNFFGLEPMVGLFAFSLLMKLLEVQQRRDIYLLLVLSLFGLATPLLFNQSLLWFLVVMAMAIAHLSLMTVLHSGVGQLFLFKPALRVALQAVPLAVLLFFIVPRLPPLWAVPMAKHQATTGLSDQLQLGGMSNLSRDTSLAFTVTFEGGIPESNQRYWRSLMLVDYDGETWLPIHPRENVDRRESGAQGEYTYQLLMPASYQRWLPVLGVAQSWPSSVFLLRDSTVQSKLPIVTRQLLTLSSQNVADLAMDSALQKRATKLPNGVHLQTRALAHALAEGYQGEQQLYALLRHFSEQSFFYTLSPAPLLGDKVDAFMFQTREGFCEHFAAAFAVMARELGFPARLATGYMGGEQSQLAPNTLSIYQYDAHAWVEVWLVGRGWVRFDPTAWINPARVDTSAIERPEWQANDLPMLEQMFWFARSQAWVMQMRHLSEWMNMRWMQFMLNYDSQGQLNFLQRWLGDIKAWKLILLAFVVMAPLALWWLFKIFWSRSTQNDPLMEVYRHLLRSSNLPMAFAPGEAARWIENQHPDLSAHVLYRLEGYWFGGEVMDRDELLRACRTLQQQLTRKLTSAR